ncbi:hypothetical protein IEQ34_000910 [Dendrobium chrysotoxum]|uniref:Uncharacterized protein n=1 Tax=Dendrobium chrysotoxum TaxID=161865 RepID=A0AAV7HNT7_DENCH|nr:hypothetical protein IEQ34_000910 [Dendrobium chrysotoxum]
MLRHYLEWKKDRDGSLVMFYYGVGALKALRRRCLGHCGTASGSTSLAASTERKHSAHSTNCGVFVLSRKFIPVIISKVFSQLRKEPRVMSTKLMVSPPKKLFPLLHLTKASSNCSTAANIKYLVVNIGSPKASDGAIVGIGREDGRAGRSPDLVNVLHNNAGLADGLISMDENGDELVDRIGLEKKLAFVKQIIWEVLVFDPLKIKSNHCPRHEGARPAPDQLHLLFFRNSDCRFETSGSTSLAASTERKHSAHSTNRGVFVLSRKFIPVILSKTFSQLRKEPRVMSTKLMVSPPKKLLPLLHLTKASSNCSTAANIKYLVVNIDSPKASDGAIVGIGREDGRAGRSPDLVNVLHNNTGLADGLISMDENGDQLVDRIGLEKKLAFVKQIIWEVLVFDPLQIKSNHCPRHEGARPEPDQLHLVFFRNSHCRSESSSKFSKDDLDFFS